MESRFLQLHALSSEVSSAQQFVQNALRLLHLFRCRGDLYKVVKDGSKSHSFAPKASWEQEFSQTCIVNSNRQPREQNLSHHIAMSP